MIQHIIVAVKNIGSNMNHHPNEIVLIISGIVALMYLAQTAMTMTLFSEEEIKEMNEAKEKQ